MSHLHTQDARTYIQMSRSVQGQAGRCFIDLLDAATRLCDVGVYAAF